MYHQFWPNELDIFRVICIKVFYKIDDPKYFNKITGLAYNIIIKETPAQVGNF